MKNYKKLLVLLVMGLALLLSSCSSGGNNVAAAYNNALNNLKEGKYSEAADTLRGISFYEDSVQLANYCKAHALAGEEKYEDAIDIFVALGAYRDSEQCVLYFRAKEAEKEANVPYAFAYAASLYEKDGIKGYLDSNERAELIRSRLYQQGADAELAENWETAAECFTAIMDYKDSAVRAGYSSGRYYENSEKQDTLVGVNAIISYDSAQGYLDSTERKQSILNDLLAQADKLIEKKDFDGAEGIYKALGKYCDESVYESLEKAKAEAEKAEREAKIKAADELLGKGEFDEARDAYLLLGETDKANEALYKKAESFIESAREADAAEIFMEIAGYRDSRERHYQLGLSLMEYNPETASKIFLADPDYSDTQNQLYNIAVSASEGNNYPLSISIYSKMDRTRDCKIRMYNDLYMYGQQLLENGEEQKAADVFDSLGGIGSAETYGNMARYAAATKLEEAGKYGEAINAFDQLGNYSDAKDKASECRYKLGKQSMENKDYKAAADLFKVLAGIKDSDDLYLESCYLLAGEYEKKGKWNEAIGLYSELKDYEESVARKRHCYEQLGEEQLANGDAEDAYKSFVNAENPNGQERAAFAVAEKKLTDVDMKGALEWYKLAATLPETEDRTAMLAKNLLNIEEDLLAEEYASVVDGSEKTQEILYALAIRSLERQDEDAAMRQMQKAGDNADASEQFRKMLENRVNNLVSQEKYLEASELCASFGDQEQANALLKMKAEKEEEKRKAAEEANREKHQARIDEANALLENKEYDAAAKIFTDIGETELAANALEQKEAVLAAERAKEEEIRNKELQERIKQGDELLAAGEYDEAIAIYTEVNNEQLVNEAIYQKAEGLGQPELYLEIADYKDSREKHYLAGKAYLESDPEKAWKILKEDLDYKDTQDVLYTLADQESKAGHYMLSSAIFTLLGQQTLDPNDLRSDCNMRSVQDLYQYGLALKDQGEYELSAVIFEQMNGLSLAQKHVNEAYYAIADGMEANGKNEQAAVAFEALGNYSDAGERAKNNRYISAQKQLESGRYDAAEKAFVDLGNYSDAKTMVQKCRYQKAKNLLDNGKPEEAEVLFDILGDYEDSGTLLQECLYLTGCKHIENQQYENALNDLSAIAEYKDAKEKIRSCYISLGDQLIKLADEQLCKGNTESAIVTYKKAVDDYQKADEVEKVKKTFYVIASCYQSMNELKTAFDWFELAGEMGVQRLNEIAHYAEVTEQHDLAEKMKTRVETIEKKIRSYEEAEEKLVAGDIDEAVRLFGELGDYRDAKLRHDQLIYQKAAACETEGKYKEAAELYASVPEYEDAEEKRKEALYVFADQLTKQDISAKTEAYKIFLSLQEYKDAAQRAQKLFSGIIGQDGIGIGSTLEFGNYEQDNNFENGQEPIEWIILDMHEGQVLLISKYGLDTLPFNTEKRQTQWETCSLREWLNREFVNVAFDEEEQSAILETVVDNGKRQNNYANFAGKNTNDRIFLLSYAESVTYKRVSTLLQGGVAPTDFAKAKGATVQKTARGEVSKWWLRSPGQSYNYAMCVSIGNYAINSIVDNNDTCVRPVLWVNLSEMISHMD